MNNKECLFCKIVAKEIPSFIVYESEKCLGFLDIFPISEGHTIIIPKNHYQTIEDIPEAELSELFKVVKQNAILIHNRLKIDGYNILQNNFRTAGQEIDHIHVHIIPRNENDNRFKLKIPRNQSSETELKEVLQKIRN